MYRRAFPGQSRERVNAVRVSAEEGIFPLAIHASGRYLVTAQGTPFFLQGDTPWSLVAQLTNAEIVQYLDDTQSRGFSAIMFNAPEKNFTSQTPLYNNVDGVAPFTSMTDFASALTAYWNRVDYAVDQSKARGIVCLINPAYLGFDGGGQGWMAEVTAESGADLQTYGQRLAQRYTQGNVIWCLGGDYQGTGTERDKQWNIVTGIRSVRTTDLITAHPGPEGLSGSDGHSFTYWNGYAGYNLHFAYPYNSNVYANVETDYNRGAGPVFMGESQYEQEPDPAIGAAEFRQQAYDALCNGACGQFVGNNPIWNFESPEALYAYTGTWESNLSSTGRQDMARMRSLIDAIAWWKLAPETGTDLVTTSLSSGATRICPALATDGTLALVWRPNSGASTVNMAAMTGVSSVRARFFDPTAGTYANVAGQPFSPSGTQSITWPAERVLVLDQA